MKDRIDEIGQRAWMDFYDQKKRLYNDDHGRKTYLTGDSNRHHRFYRAFRDIASICLQYGYDVTDYVFTCFSLVDKDHKYVTPRDFVNQKIVDAYALYKKTYGDDANTAWASQSAELRNNTARMVPQFYANAAEILKDNKMPFTAWFRVFYDEQPSPELMEIYGESAWADLQVDRRLRLFLRKLRANNMAALEKCFGYFGDVSEETQNG